MCHPNKARHTSSAGSGIDQALPFQAKTRHKKSGPEASSALKKGSWRKTSETQTFESWAKRIGFRHTRRVPPQAELTSRLSYIRQVVAVLHKELLIETRNAEVVTTSTFFALLVVVLGSFSLHAGGTNERAVAAAVVWLALAFALVLALGKSWQRERENKALLGLLLNPIFPSAVFLGKALSLCLFLLLMELMVLPLTALFFAIELGDVALQVALICLIATPGIACAGTLFGAMTARTKARELLLAIVLFPLLSPTLLTAVAATRGLLSGVELAELSDHLRLMGAFDLIFGIGGMGMFKTLVEN